MDYWKTRVERVLYRWYRVPAKGQIMVTLNLRRDSTMLGVGLDPKHGTLFYIIKCANAQGLVASIDVRWLMPDGTESYDYSTVPSVPVNQVREQRLWDGPTLPDIQVVWTFTNNAATDITLRIVADIVAKRFGGNFDTGMWLAIADDVHVRPHVPLLDPEDHAETPDRARPRHPCLPLPPLETAHRHVGMDRSEGGTAIDLPPLIQRGDIFSREHSPHRRLEYSFVQISCTPGPDCTPAESAVDWLDAQQRAPADCPPPDPELVFTMNELGTLFPTNDTAAQPLPNSLGLSVNFPAGAPSSASFSGTPLTSYLGRCRGVGFDFDADWRMVSLGLEQERPTPAHLRLLLTELPGVAGSGGWRKFDSEIAGLDSLSHRWNWQRPAPWLRSDFRNTWYIISVMTLIHNTIDLLPDEIRTRLEVDGPFRRLRRRLFHKHHVVRKRQSAWRYDGSVAPFYKIRPAGLNMTDGQSAPFNLATLDWGGNSAQWSNTFLAWFEEFQLTYRKSYGLTIPAPAPVPSVTWLHAFRFIPFADAAQKLYAYARFLTMCATFYARMSDEPAHKLFVDKARLVYRAYLTCLAIPGKTLVHELFHTVPSAGKGDVAVAASNPELIPGIEAFDLAKFLWNWYRHGSHCLSGCGQEKMGTVWFAAVGELTAMVPCLFTTFPGTPVRHLVVEHPTAFQLAGGAYVYTGGITNLFGSRCATGVQLRTRFVNWPTVPGGDTNIQIQWRADDVNHLGLTTSAHFFRHCMATNKHFHSCDDDPDLCAKVHPLP